MKRLISRIPDLSPTAYGLGLAMLALAALGPFIHIALMTLLIQLLFFTVLAYSINLITGLTGYVSFGHVVFMGAGAYALGYTVLTYAVSPLTGVALGAATGLILALAIGLVTLRFRGVYFAIASLVTALAALLIVLVTPQLKAGEGIFLNLGFHPVDWYYALWCLVAAEMAVTYWITRGRIGYGIRAIKSDEDAAKALGINAARLKLYVFCLSGLFAGAAGAVSAWQNQSVIANDAFSLSFSLMMLAMIVVGGMGTVSGPFVGSVAVYIPYYIFLTVAISAQPLVIGLLVVIIALVIPEGIVGALRHYVPGLRRILE